MSEMHEQAVSRLAAELSAWSGAEGDTGFIKGDVPDDDAHAADPYDTIDEYEQRHGVKCSDSVRAEYERERAAWVSFARRVMAELGLLAVEPALLDAVTAARARACGPNCFELDRCARCVVVEDAERALADAAIAQRGGR